MLLSHDVRVILATSIPSALVGWLGYRRAVRVDSVAAQAGVATESRAGTQQIIEGLNALVDNLQEDSATCREHVRYLEKRYAEMERKCVELRRQFNALQRKYGENGGN